MRNSFLSCYDVPNSDIGKHGRNSSAILDGMRIQNRWDGTRGATTKTNASIAIITFCGVSAHNEIHVRNNDERLS